MGKQTLFKQGKLGSVWHPYRNENFYEDKQIMNEILNMRMNNKETSFLRK